jgi:hypothetical protein
MITSDSNPGLAVNAWGGAALGTMLRLTDACDLGNPDCTFSFRNGMILSDRDWGLAVHSSRGLVSGSELQMHTQCTADSPHCNWKARIAGPQPGYSVGTAGALVPLAENPDLTAERLRALYQLSRIRTGQAIPGLPLYNPTIVMTALDEATVGRCGSAARARYDTGTGNWCSEFAFWVIDHGFSLNCCLRSTSNGGFTTADVLHAFGVAGRLVDDSQVIWGTPGISIQPGDFLGVHGSDGSDRGHAGVAVAVSQDGTSLWTVEGNVSDCVRFRRRTYMSGGALDVAIDAIGKVSQDYCGECVGMIRQP